MFNDESNNYKVQKDNNLLEIIEEEEIILKKNKKSKFKKWMNYFLYLPKLALRIIPNSSIKLPFYFKGKRSYSNWIMKLISTISLIGLGNFTVL